MTRAYVVGGVAVARSVFAGASGSRVSIQRGFANAGVRPFSAAANLPPHQELGMPSLSPTMTEGGIASFKKKVGDKVDPGDVLCEIETDKATMEMESMESGYLAKILLPAGSQNVPVGQGVMVICEEEGDIGAFADYVSAGIAPAPPTGLEAKAPATAAPAPPAAAAAAPAATPQAAAPKAPAAEGLRIIASPLAKRLARELGVPLEGITGTGEKARVTKADVLAAQARGHTGAAATQAAAATGVDGSMFFPDFTDMPVKMVQKITAQRLTESKQQIPHYYLSVDVQMDKLMKVRAALNMSQEKSGVKLSVTDFIVKASALSLMQVPAVNSSWQGDTVRRYHSADISIAVQTEHGLMVPIVKDADSKGLKHVSSDIKALALKARDNKLAPTDYTGGTFTISNLGMMGVKQFAAIVNPPQAAILAVGSAEKRVIPGKAEGTYEEGSFMCATISCDHRVVDGAVAAEWLAAFKKYMEDPMTMLL